MYSELETTLQEWTTDGDTRMILKINLISTWIKKMVVQVSTVLLWNICGVFFYLSWSTAGCSVLPCWCVWLWRIETPLMLPLLPFLASVMTAIRPQLEPFLFRIESALICCNFLLFSVHLFLLISLCFSHSLLVNCLPLWPGVCARAEWVLFSAGRRSWITQASCLAWIGIWFHLSLISGPPSSAYFVSYHASSCWMHISTCALKSYHVQSSADNARAHGTALDLRNNFAVKFWGKKS